MALGQSSTSSGAWVSKRRLNTCWRSAAIVCLDVMSMSSIRECFLGLKAWLDWREICVLVSSEFSGIGEGVEVCTLKTELAFSTLWFVPRDGFFELTPRGRPLEASRPYTQSRFLSRHALHMTWPEHRIFLDRQKPQLLLIEGCCEGLVSFRREDMMCMYEDAKEIA